MANLPTEIDQELEAIRALLAALTPLSPEGRISAVDYALRRLDIQLPRRSLISQATQSFEAGGSPAPPAPERPPTDIRTLAEQKRPRSAIEMAALVAYYLSEVAGGNDRKEAVTTDDLRKYFKQANFPLPGAIRYTLGNASAAGFFESAGRGEYRLTAVGHNLITHVLPASDEPAPRPRRTRKAAAKKPVTKTAASTASKKAAPKKPTDKQSAPRKAAAKKR
jgi:hypothetical protein